MLVWLKAFISLRPLFQGTCAYLTPTKILKSVLQRTLLIWKPAPQIHLLLFFLDIVCYQCHYCIILQLWSIFSLLNFTITAWKENYSLILKNNNYGAIKQLLEILVHLKPNFENVAFKLLCLKQDICSKSNGIHYPACPITIHKQVLIL